MKYLYKFSLRQLVKINSYERNVQISLNTFREDVESRLELRNPSNVQIINALLKFRLTKGTFSYSFCSLSACPGIILSYFSGSLWQFSHPDIHPPFLLYRSYVSNLRAGRNRASMSYIMSPVLMYKRSRLSTKPSLSFDIRST